MLVNIFKGDLKWPLLIMTRLYIRKFTRVVEMRFLKEFKMLNSVNTKGNSQNKVSAFKTDADVDIDCLIGGF